MVLGFNQFLCELSLFIHQVCQVLYLLLSPRYLICAEVVVDLSSKDLVRQAERPHLLQEVLNLHEIELFEAFSGPVNAIGARVRRRLRKPRLLRFQFVKKFLEFNTVLLI